MSKKETKAESKKVEKKISRSEKNLLNSERQDLLLCGLVRKTASILKATKIKTLKTQDEYKKLNEEEQKKEERKVCKGINADMNKILNAVISDVENGVVTPEEANKGNHKLKDFIGGFKENFETIRAEKHTEEVEKFFFSVADNFEAVKKNYEINMDSVKSKLFG